MKNILVIEDGNEYEKFALLFLGDDVEIRAAHSMEEAQALLDSKTADAFLVDLRFDRASDSQLVGGVEERGDLAPRTRYWNHRQREFT